jgi:basic membrane lipoprotein Med (substrate-binding protein (PBP1-ABC) superfamily)
MKKSLLIIALAITTTFLSGQKSIDALFDRYSGKDGFVTFTISGNLLKLACIDDENDDNPFPAKVTEIRILAQEDNNIKVDNFYSVVIRNLNLDDYEEFMRVKESDQDLRMLVRSEGNTFREFLLIAGGEDNALIQIKGSMTFKEAKKLSSDLKKNHCMNILAEHK